VFEKEHQISVLYTKPTTSF